MVNFTMYIDRYKRQIMMKDFGEEKQKVLKNSCVFIGGIGGLGGATATYLACAGIGKMVIAHYGSLTETNMNRQTLMDCAQIGSPRIDVAKENLIKLNPDMELELYNERLEPENIRSLIKDADIAVSARPNFPERLTLNEACVKKGIPMIEAAMDDMSGYLFTVNPGESACLACLVENDNPEGWKELGFGVLGAVSGTIGCLAAVEAVKVLTGYGEPLGSRMYHLDMLTMRSITPELKRNPHCRVCGNK